MAELLTPDICVIGAGSGGLSVAAAAAAFGVPVVLIEKHKMGGDCLNTGCVPSKALIAAARRRQLAGGSAGFGVRVESADVAFKDVHRHVHRVIAAIAPNDSTERFTGLGIKVIAGEARFSDPDTVSVGNEWQIKARRFVVAAGSSPAIPSIPGLDKARYLTNETIFDLRECPRHLAVIGGGPIGLELAQAFRRLGADVTVLEAEQFLAKDDSECTAIVLDRLARDGVVLRSGVRINRVERGKDNSRIFVANGDSEEIIACSHILVAAGRQANVDGLDLERAGIKYERKGIVVNKGLRTTNKRVYAVGDIAGGLQFTHVANYHAGLVVRNALFRLPVAVNDDVVPRVTFTDPELAHVGLTETQARERHSRIRVLRWPFHDNDRAQTERATEGHIKVITNSRGTILGATIVGAEAGELISAWTLAVSRRLNIRAMASVVFAYPTRAEVGKRAAIAFFAPSLTSPLVRRIIRMLRRLG